MARPIELKANTPGGNTFKKSAAAQRPYKSKPVNMGPVKVPSRSPKRLSTDGTKGATLSKAEAGYVPPIMGGNSMDYASSWMQSKGLKNAQNDGRVARVPYATVPADRLTAGQSMKAKSQVASSKTATKKPGSRAGTSNASVKPRVKTQYTGKSYKTSALRRSTTKKAVVLGS